MRLRTWVSNVRGRKERSQHTLTKHFYAAVWNKRPTKPTKLRTYIADAHRTVILSRSYLPINAVHSLHWIRWRLLYVGAHIRTLIFAAVPRRHQSERLAEQKGNLFVLNFRYFFSVWVCFISFFLVCFYFACIRTRISNRNDSAIHASVRARSIRHANLISRFPFLYLSCPFEPIEWYVWSSDIELKISTISSLPSLPIPFSARQPSLTTMLTREESIVTMSTTTKKQHNGTNESSYKRK